MGARSYGAYDDLPSANTRVAPNTVGKAPKEGECQERRPTPYSVTTTCFQGSHAKVATLELRVLQGNRGGEKILGHQQLNPQRSSPPEAPVTTALCNATACFFRMERAVEFQAATPEPRLLPAPWRRWAWPQSLSPESRCAAPAASPGCAGPRERPGPQRHGAGLTGRRAVAWRLWSRILPICRRLHKHSSNVERSVLLRPQDCTMPPSHLQSLAFRSPEPPTTSRGGAHGVHGLHASRAFAPGAGTYCCCCCCC